MEVSTGMSEVEERNSGRAVQCHTLLLQLMTTWITCQTICSFRALDAGSADGNILRSTSTRVPTDDCCHNCHPAFSGTEN